MTKEIMTPLNERWDEFMSRLVGKEGCDFKENIIGDPNSLTWNCSSEQDRLLAISILEKMGNINITETLKYFSEHGGYCDCEIIFNVNKYESYETVCQN